MGIGLAMQIDVVGRLERIDTAERPSSTSGMQFSPGMYKHHVEDQSKHTHSESRAREEMTLP